MTKRIFVFAMVFSLVCTVAFAQKAGPRGGEPKGMKGDMKGCPQMMDYGMMGLMDIDALKQKLKLTDEQVKKINELKLNHKKEMLKYEEALAPKNIRVKRLLLDDPVNFEEVKALIMDIAKTQGEMHVEKLKYRLDFEQILTPEQRVTFKTMHKGRMMMDEKMKMGDKMKKGEKTKKMEHQH